MGNDEFRMDDLLAFMMALENGDLVSDEVYQQMTDFSERFDKGIYYGMGMFYIDFSYMTSKKDKSSG